jgi:hypothetical protein
MYKEGPTPKLAAIIADITEKGEQDNDQPGWKSSRAGPRLPPL